MAAVVVVASMLTDAAVFFVDVVDDFVGSILFILLFVSLAS